MSTTVSARRLTFFKVILGENKGYVCISRRQPDTGTFEEDYFMYPDQVDAMVEHIQRFAATHNVYFCPQLLDKPKRSKENVAICPTAWADLDTCPPDELLIKPTVLIETSPNRYQALWLFEAPVDPVTAEDVSRRIAYHHADEGADKSGWDLTQLLRVPFTYNHKYHGTGALPQVKIVSTNEDDLSVRDFDVYPEAKSAEANLPFPKELPKASAEDILESRRTELHPQVWTLFNETPSEDWSRALWQLEVLLLENGVPVEEVFVVVRESACNKYKRDRKSDRLLWNDVTRAYAHVLNKNRGVPFAPQEAKLKELLTDGEREDCQKHNTIVEDYIEWARTLGDAAWQYHQAGAFIILSSLLAGSVRLPTSYGVVLPNLWFMILADTTLTRKTTAMDLAMDLLVEIDSDSVLATDGSIEGLMTSLSTRPGRPSVFLRDEFSGLLDALVKKDYYAGMAETLTKLYDGKFQKRVLRKEIIEVRDPVLIFFAGGIKTRVMELLTLDHVMSGFLPRFVLITAESDISTLRPLGPPTTKTLERRASIMSRLQSIHQHYNVDQKVTIGDKVVTGPRKWDASLTEEAWARYNDFEAKMLDSGLNSMYREALTPTFDRLAKSGLKAAVLLAATRNLEERIVVDEDDIVRAFYYVENWRDHAYQVTKNIGRGRSERMMERILVAIKRETGGVMRSQIMQHYHLNARDTDHLLMTLEQRGQITRIKSGRTERLYATEAGK